VDTVVTGKHGTSYQFTVLSGVRQGCVVAPDLFLNPMGLVVLAHCTLSHMVGTSVGSEWFSGMDFADAVVLLVEMLCLLVLAHEIMDEEARPLGLTINWSKTKIQTMLDPALAGTSLQINVHSVEVVKSFPYLESLIHCNPLYL